MTRKPATYSPPRPRGRRLHCPSASWLRDVPLRNVWAHAGSNQGAVLPGRRPARQGRRPDADDRARHRRTGRSPACAGTPAGRGVSTGRGRPGRPVAGGARSVVTDTRPIPNPARPDPASRAGGRSSRTPKAAIRSRPSSRPRIRSRSSRTAVPTAARATARRTSTFARLARGYAELATQMYFAGERLNGSDLVLRRVAVADRRKVVIEPDRDADGLPLFAFDMVLARA